MYNLYEFLKRRKIVENESNGDKRVCVRKKEKKKVGRFALRKKLISLYFIFLFLFSKLETTVSPSSVLIRLFKFGRPKLNRSILLLPIYPFT